ncbi:unnamed protein product [Cylicocyclus nassatus]|uniref:Uncharacterized protein n=1 Tax=Cylicocyclus nassatus TaxID=53992 RepID=A0AA36DJV5_CYLNA|nr:unnamed protein product [Cylicocyclus nassatus]
MYARIILVVLLLNAVRRSEGEAGGITSEDTIGAGDTAARSESAGKNNGEAEAVETSEDRTEEGRNGAVETVAGSKGEIAAQGAKNGVAPGGSNDACVTQKHADESGSAGDAGKKTEGHLVNCQTIANSAMDKFIKQSPNAGNNELSTPPLECHSFAVDLSKGPHKDFKAFCKFVTYDVKNPKDMREHLTKLNGTEFSRLAYVSDLSSVRATASTLL